MSLHGNALNDMVFYLYSSLKHRLPQCPIDEFIPFSVFSIWNIFGIKYIVLRQKYIHLAASTRESWAAVQRQETATILL